MQAYYTISSRHTKHPELSAAWPEYTCNFISVWASCSYYGVEGHMNVAGYLLDCADPRTSALVPDGPKVSLHCR